MPWLSNILLDGLFVAQTPEAVTTPAPAGGTPDTGATPITVATPAAPATPDGVLATPAAPGTPDGVLATPATPAPAEATPGMKDTPAGAVPGDQGTPTQQVAAPPPIQYQDIAPSFGVPQWLMLGVFACVCAGLITCVLFQNSKSDGLGGPLMGGGSMSTFRGKKSSEEKLSQLTSYLATAFIICSLGMAMMFH